MEYVFPFDNEEMVCDNSDDDFTLKKINKQIIGLFNLGECNNYNNNQFMCEFFEKFTKLMMYCEYIPFYFNENLKDIILCFDGSFGALDKSFFAKISILAKNPYHYVYGMLFYDLNSRKFTSCCSNEAMEYIYQYLLNNEHYKFLCKNLPKELVFELFKY